MVVEGIVAFRVCNYDQYQYSGERGTACYYWETRVEACSGGSRWIYTTAVRPIIQALWSETDIRLLFVRGR
jgi:hypothetical protein